MNLKKPNTNTKITSTKQSTSSTPPKASTSSTPPKASTSSTSTTSSKTPEASTSTKTSDAPKTSDASTSSKPPEASDEKTPPPQDNNDSQDLAKIANVGTNKELLKTNNCTGRDYEKPLRDFAQGKINYENMLRKIQPNIINFAKNLFNNPKECAGMIIDNIDFTAIPKNIVKGIGQEISGLIDGVTNSFKNLAKEFKNNPIMPDGITDIAKPFNIAKLLLILKLQNIASKFVFGKDAKDINVNLDTLAKDINRNRLKYEKIIHHPDFQKIFDEWSKGTANNLLDTLDLLQPNIDKVTGKIDNMINETSGHLGDTAGNALVNFLNNVIAAIPGVGAALNVVSTAGTLANQIVETCKPVVETAAATILPAVNLTEDAIDKAKCKLLSLQDQTEPIRNSVENKMNAEEAKAKEKKTGTATAAAAAGGGGNHPHQHPRRNTKRIKENIKHTTKRIQKLLSRHFTRNNKNNNNKNDTFHREKTLKKSYLRFVRR